jgi:hypothetical protein
MASKNTGSISAQPPDITIEEMYTFFALIIQIDMTSVAASKIIGPERSSIALHFIQT